MTVIRTAAAAVLAAVVLAVTAAGWPVPHGAVAVSAAARACQPGTINWSANPGPPGDIASWWVTNGCGQYQSPKLEDTGGGIHYGDSWRTAVGTRSVASSPNAISKAWLRYKDTPGGQHYCLRVYPSRGSSWFACT